MRNIDTTLYTLTEGLSELPTDDVARVKHFLVEYLGNGRHPVPFGGRTMDFARLDSWLFEHEGPAYALMAAPAGRGKSALLLRWCQRLLTRSDLAVVYFPVSIRFRTNLAGVVFPALVALLARLHGENIPNDLHTHEEIWHGLLTDYITRPLPDGRRLLLVLDGIDEAADWDAGPWLFPVDPPAGLRVVLSARYLANDLDANAWLTRLGWTREGLARTLELYPLDRAGIASVLIQMGFPLDLLGTRVDIVSELHRLSEGDPLLIRLYVDDLWERGDAVTRLTPEDLHAIRPGLLGYFERWWNEQRSLWNREAPQREAAVQTILGLLAGALGPLSTEDILNLAPDDSLLRSGRIEQHLEPLERFVIGDGMRQGYVFSHPRLASYFLEERLGEVERQEVEQRFLTWGARTLAELNTGKLAPAEASPYIVHYYGAHLERAQAEAGAIFALVSDGWRRAWEKLDRANAGFLGDSERAWRAAERENLAASSAGQAVPLLDMELLSLLCRVSINSMTSNVPPRLMLEAVKTGVWTPAQGLASIRLIVDPASRARELVGLAPSVQEPLRTDILQEALDTIPSLKYERDRLDTLVELSPGFTAGLLEQILEIVHAVEDEADRAGVLAELAPALAIVPELIEKALDIAREIEEEEYFVLALEGLVPYLNLEQTQHILHLTRSMEDERYRAQAFAALVPHLPASLLLDILAESQNMRVSISQVHLLATLVNALPESARDEALQATLDLLSEIIDQEYRVDILLKLAPRLPAERLQHLLSEIQALWDEGYRARALCDLLPALPEEQLPAFLASALSLKHEEQRVIVLLQALPRLPENLRAIVLENIPAIWDEGLRVKVLARLAPVLEADLRPRLLEQVHTTKDPGYRIWLLTELETALADQQYSSAIAETFLAMKHTDERLQTLLAIADRVSDEALNKIFALLEPEIFGFHVSLQSADHQADIFAKLAPRIPQAWFTRTLRLVRAMEKEISQVQVLLALAPRIDENHLPAVLDIVRSMKTRDKRSQVLEALVAALPQARKGERVREMLQVLQIIKDESERAAVFEAFIAPLRIAFPPGNMRAVLLAIAAMHSEIRQAHILAALVPHLAAEQFETVLYALPAMWSEEERARVLIALVPYLPEHLLTNFFATLQTLKDEQVRASTLMTLAEHASPAAFSRLLTLAQDIRDQNEQAKILGVLATHLPEAAFPQFWAILQRYQNTGHRAWLLNALAAHVPAKYFAPFWSALQEIQDQGWQMRALTTLAAHTPENSYSQLWTAVQQNTDERWRIIAITALADSVPASFFPQVLQEALALPITSIPLHLRTELEKRPENVLEVLAETVPENFFLPFWRVVCQMDDKWQRVRLLQKLATHVPTSCFAEVWPTVSQVEANPQQQEQLYERLARHVPEYMFGQIWQTAEAIEDPWYSDKWLVALSFCVPESFMAPFWQAVKTMQDVNKQAFILKVLAPRLSQEQLAEGIDMALAFSPPGIGVEVVEHLLPLLSTAQCDEFLARMLPVQWHEEELVEIFRGMLRKYRWWKQIAIALVPHLSEECLQTISPALSQAILEQLSSDEDRVENLNKLVGHVPESTLPAVLEAIWSIQMAGGWNNALSALLTSPHFTPRAWLQVLEIAGEKTRSTGETRYLLQVLKVAPIELQRTAPEQLYRALHRMLLLLAQRTRREALADLVSLETTLRALGGEETNLAIACATLEIGCWWP